MKIFIKISFVLMSLCAKSFSQSSDPKKDLQGKWETSCPIEYIDMSSMQFCELCVLVIDPNDNSKAELQSPKITFNGDSIKIKNSLGSQTCAYTTNKDNRSIQFKYNGKDIKFRVLYGDNILYLEDPEGLILVLEKSKK